MDPNTIASGIQESVLVRGIPSPLRGSQFSRYGERGEFRGDSIFRLACFLHTTDPIIKSPQQTFPSGVARMSMGTS